MSTFFVPPGSLADPVDVDADVGTATSALPTNGTMYRHCTKISRPWFLTDSVPAATSFGDVPGAGTGLTMTRRASAFC
ncbi:hypothetical protein [Burkholderia pyrrocinia]|uniref:hypothetical protein n=1 Tax=Burkholderia pyrrocinia TaxID=60550 RepID=UPI00130EC584|nr:hypothetical protein [Burkholderia pyrrocinia]